MPVTMRHRAECAPPPKARDLTPEKRQAARLAAFVLLAGTFFGIPQAVHAQQCNTNPANGGILQSGGTCVANTPVSTGFGTAVDASNSANVTTNGAVTATGGGTGVSATTNATVTVNGNVTAAGI